MSSKLDFSDDEWAQLRETVESVGMGMVLGAKSGLIGKVRKLVALSSCLAPKTISPQFTHNELVVALVEDFRTAPIGPAYYYAHHDIGGLIVTLLVGRLSMVSWCEQSSELLALRCPPREADGVKKWLLWIARTVSDAGRKRRLTLRCKKISPEESLQAQLADALRVSLVATVPTSSELERMLGVARIG